MGAVYLATELKLNRRVAVKVVSRKLGAGTEAEARFLREARSMAQVEHPHIVRVYSFGEIEGQPYLVMEYVEGVDLAARIAREGSLPLEEALRITRQVAEALEAAWEHRVVHRDIKPSNILLDKRNQVRVADFGLAKPMRADASALLTQESYVLGTPHYASPEQVRGLPLDFRSDIYSLGIVLYEMLTGQRPFEGATPFDILNKQVMQPLPFLEQKRPDLPRAVAQLVAWMTMKDAGRRPASHRELVEALDSVQRGGTVQITPAEMYAPPTPPPARVQPRRLPPLIYPALALVLVAAVVLGWFQWRQTPATDSPAKGLVVAVTPFYGPDEDSTKEGRVMAALVERAVADRLGRYDVKVLGVEETKEPVRSHEAARALGEQLGATVVVWGEAFALRGETEIQPYFTLIPPKQAPEKKPDLAAQRAALGADPLAALQQRSAETMRVGASAPNQIEVRKTSAAGIGDVVLFLAGLHALRFENDTKKALEFFQAAPRTAESLRYMAEAHLSAGQKDQALAVVREAVRLEPRSAPAQAMLGDLELGAGRLPEAAAAYQAALLAGGEFSSTEGIWYDGKLYAREMEQTPQQQHLGSGYLLALDPSTGKVLERYRLPQVPTHFRTTENGFRLSYEYFPDVPEAEIGLERGKFDRPIFYGGNLWLRRRSQWAGEQLAYNFTATLRKLRDEGATRFPARGVGGFRGAPNTVEELEAATRRAAERDPTQPWHLFFLGQALWAQDKQAEAEKTWEAMFAGAFPGTPYFEYLWMASYFESLRQERWADRAFEEALRRRRKEPQPIGGSGFLIERLINAPFVSIAASRSQRGEQLERAHLWLERARTITGPVTEADELAAAAWEKYFRERGELDNAEHERAFAARVRGLTELGEVWWTRFDLAVFLLAAATLSFFLLLFLVLRNAAARAAAQTADIQTSAWCLWLGGLKWIVLVLVTGGGALMLVAGATLLVLGAPNPLAAATLGGIGLVVLLGVVFHRRLWRGPGLPELVGAIPTGERRALLAAALVVALADVLLASQTVPLLAVMSLPVGMMDSNGHAEIVWELEQDLTRRDTPRRRWPAAVANHMAGNIERARELYRSLGSDPRAQKNLQALNRGELVPPVLLTPEDVMLSRSDKHWWVWLDIGLRPARGDISAFYGDSPVLGVALGLLTLGLWLVLAITVILAMTFRGIPAQRQQEAAVSSDARRRWLNRVGLALLPGALDIRRGAVWRGYFILLLACLVVGVAAARAYVAVVPGAVPSAPGFVTPVMVPFVAKSFPLPSPPGLTSPEEVMAYHFWTFFWAYPYARFFWLFSGLSALFVLVYHATRLR